MQHQRTNRKLGMKSPHRRAMLRNLATSLVMHERVRTTDTRAKEVRRVVEKMITLAKRGDLTSLRLADGIIRCNEAVGKLFEDLGKRYQERPGGYTRMIRVGRRQGDNAPMVIIELVEAELTKKAPKRKKKAEPKAVAAPVPAEEQAAEEAPASTEAPASETEPSAEAEGGKKE